MHEWNYYGAPPEGGLYRVGDYIYNWYPQSGEVFIYASPSKNYGSQNQLKVTDTKVRDGIVAEISAKGAKLTKDQARAAAADIEARNKPKAPAAPAAPAVTTTPAPAESTSWVPTWIYDPNAAFYQQGYFYALVAAGSIAVALNWDSIMKMVGMGKSAATPALANPARKNKMKKYSNPRKNRKHRRNREEEVEEEVEEIDEDEE